MLGIASDLLTDFPFEHVRRRIPVSYSQGTFQYELSINRGSNFDGRLYGGDGRRCRRFVDAVARIDERSRCPKGKRVGFPYKSSCF